VDIPPVLIFWLLLAFGRWLWDTVSSGSNPPARTTTSPASAPHVGQPRSVFSLSLVTTPGNSHTSGSSISATLAGNLALRRDQIRHGGVPIAVYGRVVDVTSGHEEDVLSLSPENRDQDMSVSFIQKVNVPVAASDHSAAFLRVELPARRVFSLALDKMVPPHPGKRRFVAQVVIAEDGGHGFEEERVIAVAQSDPVEVRFEGSLGYMQAAAHAKDVETALVRVAAAAASASGKTTRLEIQQVSSLLSSRYAGSSDWYGNSLDGLNIAEVKVRATETLRSAAAQLASEPRSAADLLEEACGQLRGSFLPTVAQDAFEVAVKVVVADGRIEPQEEQFLNTVARKLGLDGKLVQKIKDLHMPLSMRTDGSSAAALGLPEGLSVQEQRAWLAAEYEKWRNRASNQDPAIASEAEARLSAIARVRADLDAE
jgi:hypothetical protein